MLLTTSLSGEQKRLLVLQLMASATLHSTVMAPSERGNMQISTGNLEMCLLQPICKLARAYLEMRLLCVPWRHQRLQCGACINSCMLSSSVASLLPTKRPSRRPLVGKMAQSMNQQCNKCAYFRAHISCLAQSVHACARYSVQSP